MSSNAAEFNNVSKVYSKYIGLQKLKNFLDVLKNGQLGKKLIREADFYALNNVSFSVKTKEFLGIIGSNGAGKSTILKIINRITYPSRGKVRINGNVGGLLELGAGFHPNLSGRDNVFINAALNGFSKKQTSEIFNEVLDISELHHFIDVPIKKYSSGMLVRLGFAVAMATNPDIVLLDEVLAVGDEKFKQKSMKLMQEYIANKTVIFVSHAMDLIKQMCNRVIVLDHGKIIYAGTPNEAVNFYTETIVQQKDEKNSKTIISKNVKRGFAEVFKVEVESVQLYNYDYKRIEKVLKGERIIINCILKITRVLGDLNVRIMVKKLIMDKFSEVMDEYYIDIPAKKIESNVKEINLSFNTGNLKAGKYTIEIVPEFKKQSGKMAVSVYSLPLLIESKSEEENIGLIDLDFEIEKSRMYN